MKRSDLRERALQGGTVLLVRQAAGMVIALGSVLVVSRIIGPAQYGLYAAAAGLMLFLQGASQWGIGVYLVRQEGDTPDEVFHQAFTLLTLLGLLSVGLAVVTLPWVAGWTRLVGVGPLWLALVLGLPLAQANLVPLARLERGLRYRVVAATELAGQLTSFLLALAGALTGLGAWALVAGWWGQQLVATVCLHAATGYRPRPWWDARLVRGMLGYGTGYAASIWIWQLRTLVNPLLVGRFAGAEAVAYVALALRFVELLSFVKSAAWRLSLVVLSRLQDEPERMRGAIAEGMRFQAMAIGPLMAVFAALAPLIVPPFFGGRWLPVAALFPFLALGVMVNALFNLHSAALYVLQRNWAVACFHAVHIVLFAGAAAFLVPRMGALGYAWAEVVALPGYWVVHLQVAKAVGRPSYGPACLWTVSSGCALFLGPTIPWAWLCLALPLLATSTRRDLGSLATRFFPPRPVLNEG